MGWSRATKSWRARLDVVAGIPTISTIRRMRIVLLMAIATVKNRDAMVTRSIFQSFVLYIRSSEEPGVNPGLPSNGK